MHLLARANVAAANDRPGGRRVVALQRVPGRGRSVGRAHAALIGLVLLGAGLRFGTLAGQSLWYDEAVSASLVRKSFGGMLRTLPHSEATPPLWYVLEWVWVRIFGTGEFGLRSLSALVGTLLIPIAYGVARVFLHRHVYGVAVAAFLAVSPIMVWYSQEARSYELYVFLSALSMLFFGRALGQPAPRALWAWAASSSLAIATHYFAGFLVAGEASILLIRLGPRRCAPQIALVAAVAASLIPLADYQNAHVVSGLTVSGSSVASRLRETGIRFAVFFTRPGGTAVLIIALAGALVLAWRGRRVGQSRTALLLAASTLGLPIFLAASGIADVFNFRNVLAAWLPLVIAIAAGIPAARSGAGVTIAILLGLLTATVAIATRTGPQRDSWRQAAQTLKRIPGRRLIVGEKGELTYTLPYYWPRLGSLPPSGARIREIDLVGHVTVDDLSRLSPDFRLVANEKAGNLIIIRLRAQHTVRVTPEEISRSGYLRGRLAPS